MRTDQDLPVLVVDDDPAVLGGIRRTVGRRFPIVTADHAEAAIELVRTAGPFAVVVTDFQMPGVDGIELLRRLRAVSPDTVGLLLTGRGDMSTAVRAVNEGHVFGFLQKPCSPPVLEEQLRAALAQHSLIRRGRRGGRPEPERDPLTGLLTGPAFRAELERLAPTAAERGEVLVAVVSQLDGRSAVGDGHEPAGDEALAQAGAVLRRLGRGVLLGREGDRVVMAMPARSAGAGEARARRLTACVAAVDGEAGAGTPAGASAGISVGRPGAAPLDVLAQAEAALVVAMSRGGGVQVADAHLRASVRDRLGIERSLHALFEGGRLDLHYQPVFALRSDATVALDGTEALLRWSHPDRGAIPTDRFVPVAESMGYDAAVSAWALSAACEQLATWSGAGADHISMGVNVSHHQVLSPAFAAAVAATLTRTGVGPERLVLEVAEPVLTQGAAAASAALAELRALGVRVAVDDFGRERSSVGKLPLVNADVVKIDRSLVRGIGRSARSASLMASIVNVARSLGLRTVAVGVEDLPQLRDLAELGCDGVQGLCVGRPAAPHALSGLIAEASTARRFARAAPSTGPS